MTPKEIRLLFPITVKITPEHREAAIKIGGLHKLGEILLKESLPEILHEILFWGLSIGTVGGVLLKTDRKEIYRDKSMMVPAYLDKNFLDEEITFELR